MTCSSHTINANWTIYPPILYKRSSMLLTPSKISLCLVSKLTSWIGFCQVIPGAWTSANTRSPRSSGSEPAVMCSLFFPNSFQAATVGERVVCCVKVPASSCISSLAKAVINCARAATSPIPVLSLSQCQYLCLHTAILPQHMHCGARLQSGGSVNVKL